MALTALDLIDEAKLASSSERPSNDSSWERIINQALSRFNTMHAWESMIRPEVQLGTTASQNYIVLPSDLRDVLGLFDASGDHDHIRWVTAQRLTHIRALDETPDNASWRWYVALERRVASSGGGTDLALAIHPPPSATESDVFRLRYRAKLTPLNRGSSSDKAYIAIPEELEELLLRLVRIYALGIEEEDEGALEVRLQGFLGGDYVSQLMIWDGSQQPSIGELEGGAAEQVYFGPYFGDESVEAPS